VSKIPPTGFAMILGGFEVKQHELITLTRVFNGFSVAGFDNDMLTVTVFTTRSFSWLSPNIDVLMFFCFFNN
jgi:hypothetical protein